MDPEQFAVLLRSLDPLKAVLIQSGVLQFSLSEKHQGDIRRRAYDSARNGAKLACFFSVESASRPRICLDTAKTSTLSMSSFVVNQNACINQCAKLIHCLHAFYRMAAKYFFIHFGGSITYEWVAALQLEQLEGVVTKVVGLFVMVYNARRHIWLITGALNGMCPECMTQKKMSLLHSCKDYTTPLVIYGNAEGNNVDHEGYIHDAISELSYPWLKVEVATAIEELGLSEKMIEFLPAIFRKVTVRDFSLLLQRVQKRTFLIYQFYKKNVRVLMPTFCTQAARTSLSSRLREPSSMVVGHTQYRRQMQCASVVHLHGNVHSLVKNLPRGALSRVLYDDPDLSQSDTPTLS